MTEEKDNYIIIATKSQVGSDNDGYTVYRDPEVVMFQGESLEKAMEELQFSLTDRQMQDIAKNNSDER